MNPTSMRAVMIRLSIPVVIVIAATICMEIGVAAQRQPEISTEGFLMHVLHAVSLFKVGGIAMGEPVGGPAWARVLLYVMYFAAPAVSAGAIFEALFRLARLRLRFVLYKGDHAVILGSGRGSVDLPELIRSVHTRRSFWFWLSRAPNVIIADTSEESLLRHSTDVHKVKADATDSQIVNLLALDRARIIFLLTDNDQANIDLFFRLQHALADAGRTAMPQMFIRVRDMDLVRALRSYNTAGSVRFFNPHVEVVRSLFTLPQSVEENVWVSELRSRNMAVDHNWRLILSIRRMQPERIVFIGFGRFGQNLLLEMLTREDGSMVDYLQSVCVISPEAGTEWAHFERLMLASVGPSRQLPEPTLIAARHCDVALLQQEARGSDGIRTMWVVCTNDTSVNMQAASVVQRLYGMHPSAVCPGSTLLVRTDTFSMAYERLLSTGAVDGLTHVILPVYHVLGAYYYRRMTEEVGQ